MFKLGKYQIRRPLGKGAMGIVYEGFDPLIERTVAIKTILPAQLAGDQRTAVMARFRREAQAAGRLNHPGIVAIYDYGEDNALPNTDNEATNPGVPIKAPDQTVAYIAMEFVKGRELKDIMEAGERFTLTEAVRVVGELLDALDHAHSQGVTHRDIKPANLILLNNGRVKVADFGIARVEASELTQAGTVMGTPYYMSPEQFMGHTVDGRSDIFSCGVVLYQLVTGERPFTGETSTTIMYKVLREDPVPPSELNLSITPALDAVVRKALAKQPEQRFQTAGEFAATLRAAVAGNTDASTVMKQPVQPIVVPASTPAALHTPIPMPAAMPARRNTAAWATAGVAGLVVVAAGGYMGMRSNTPPAPAAAQAAPVTVAAAPAAPSAPSQAAAQATDSGTLVISALGLVDPKDTRFSGNAAAAQEGARNDARRQLVEKAVALYVDKTSLDSNYGVIQQKLLPNSGSFIRTVLQEGAPVSGKDGLVETQTRAVVNVRDVQRALNQLSREERIDFIRNKGDPRISIEITVGNAEATAPLPRDRSQLAENVVKDRIKSFGFRVWSPQGEGAAGPNAQKADFAIRGEAKVKQLSAKLAASGLTVTKTVLTSWTLKAVDVATGEEVYLSTKLPAGQSWNTEDQALADIGKLVGDEFSRNFFLQHFQFRTQKTGLTVTGLPDAALPLMLRELQGSRVVLDAQSLGGGKFQLILPEGSSSDFVQEAVVRPLNTKLGKDCLALAGSRDTEVTVAFSAGCANTDTYTRIESAPPAGWMKQPGAKTI